MKTESSDRVVVLGVGNTLLQDDGAGIHVTEALRGRQLEFPQLDVIDGGTIGLSLLPTIEDAAAVIVVDAAELGEAAGTLRVFHGEEIDRHLSRGRRSVHEVALADLFAAAAIRGRCPQRRALIGIQPACVEWGLAPTESIQRAIPRACAAVADLLRGWQQEDNHGHPA